MATIRGNDSITFKISASAAIKISINNKMEDQQLSEVEAELYDRQIRLWGIESQEKLRAADVLLIGIRGLGAEIAKNILLSGINSLTILDNNDVTEDDLISNFLLSRTSKLGNKIAEEVLVKAQALNPLVKITADTTPLSSKQSKFFENFTIIVATGIKFDTILKLDQICRDNNVKFIYGDTFGMFGFSVVDFQEHDYFEDRVQLKGKRKHGGDGVKITVKVKGNINYPSINKVLILPNTKQDISSIKKSTRPNNLFVCMLSLIEFRKKFDRNPDVEKREHDVEILKTISDEIIELYKITNLPNIENLFNLIFGQVAPVNAILGGIIAQEIIKAVSHKEVTINNVFVFDPLTYSGKELVIGA